MTRASASVDQSSAATSVPKRELNDPLESLRRFLDTLDMKKKVGPAAFAEFERELHERVMAVERDVLASEMKKLDVDAEAVVIDGRVHRRVLRQSQTYMTSAGEVVVERVLYKDRTDKEGRCVSPLELTLGIIGDFWTPRAAQQALWVVTQMTPKKSEELFKRIGNMGPSKSSLDRLPKLISQRWEGDREVFEAELRSAFQVPAEAVSIVVSLDGVFAPLEAGTEVTRRRADAASEGRQTQGPLGFREVGCGTVSFCDENGDLLAAVRMARSPERKKPTLKGMLAREVEAALRERPDLRLVKLADAGSDNWEFLSEQLPPGEEAVDFFHATERLHAAIAAAYGDGSHETQYRYNTLREKLRDKPKGADSVIRALKHLAKTHRRKVIDHALEYFRKHRKRMRYAELKAQGLPIGSGPVEAACKTLVSQRMKNSGMRWSSAGAQAILTPRGWDQSERFDEAWALIAATFHTEVTLMANVIALRRSPPKRGRKPSR